MGDVRDRYARLFRRGEGTDRLQFFSDAVFAIALTLLVLDIRLPEGGGDLFSELVALCPEYLAFALSFVIIAVNWMTHHAKFRVIARFDQTLIRLNFVVLFLVAWVPFPTSVLSEHDGPETPAVVLYAASVAALSLAQLAVWAYAYRAGLVDPGVDRAMFRYVLAHTLPAPVVFVLSIPLALIAPEWAMWSWLLIVPATWVAAALGRRGEGAGEDVGARV